jgi:hypothetical protein
MTGVAAARFAKSRLKLTPQPTSIPPQRYTFDLASCNPARVTVPASPCPPPLPPPPQVQLQKRKVLMLQQQHDGMKGTLGATRATMGGINSAREKAVGLAKQITILENRLEKQYIKYNEVGIGHSSDGGAKGSNLGRP